jgi:hypothetical protein
MTIMPTGPELREHAVSSGFECISFDLARAVLTTKCGNFLKHTLVDSAVNRLRYRVPPSILFAAC